MTLTDSSQEGQRRTACLRHVQAAVRFISYEPLLGPINYIPGWVERIIIGAMTGLDAVKPQREWVAALINAADAASIPVFLKDNLGWPEVRREWPN